MGQHTADSHSRCVLPACCSSQSEAPIVANELDEEKVHVVLAVGLQIAGYGFVSLANLQSKEVVRLVEAPSALALSAKLHVASSYAEVEAFGAQAEADRCICH